MQILLAEALSFQSRITPHDAMAILISAAGCAREHFSDFKVLVNLMANGQSLHIDFCCMYVHPSVEHMPYGSVVQSRRIFDA